MIVRTIVFEFVLNKGNKSNIDLVVFLEESLESQDIEKLNFKNTFVKKNLFSYSSRIILGGCETLSYSYIICGKMVITHDHS